ncbi:hypothetical protein, partial [Streptococcus suis]|uniref:hypothetical protein n=1 Tax=Streptococcus suis TaxID=1307 RepID=UPI0037CEBC8E
ALKQPFFSKNSKKDKHQNDVCLQSEGPEDLFIMSLKIRKRIRSSGPFRLKKKSILDNFLQSFFFMLKIKNYQKREISMFIRV